MTVLISMVIIEMGIFIKWYDYNFMEDVSTITHTSQVLWVVFTMVILLSIKMVYTNINKINV